MAVASALRRRRWIAFGLTLVVPLAVLLGGGHRGEHMMRSLVLPGAGLVGANNAVAVTCLVAAMVATVAWVRWGVDWLLVIVVLVAVVVSGLMGETHHESVGGLARPVTASHEFPLVILAAGLISWLRGISGRIPGLSHLARHRARKSEGLCSIDRLHPADKSRTSAVLALAGDAGQAASIATDPAIIHRARRVGALARLRVSGNPLRVDHAHARAALLLTGTADATEATRFANDAKRTRVGVPCSEPTWVRPLDGALAALALHRCGGPTDEWVAALESAFPLRHGHRAAWYWTPLGWHAGSAPAWEHAAATGLARAMGWVGDADWAALRTRALGASARGSEHPHDERLIAAARIWLAFVDDPRAVPLLARPTVRHDPLAVALDRLASRLAADPDALTTKHTEVTA